MKNRPRAEGEVANLHTAAWEGAAKLEENGRPGDLTQGEETYAQLFNEIGRLKRDFSPRSGKGGALLIPAKVMSYPGSLELGSPYGKESPDGTLLMQQPIAGISHYGFGRAGL